jgi:drug/metabolite transporter (DMT)-like permease
VACAILAIGLVSIGPRGGGPVSAALIAQSLLAGAMFGAFTSMLGQASAAAGMWSLAGVRATSIGLGLVVVWRSGGSLRLPRALWPTVVAAGGLDVAANAFYVAAAARGHLSVVAPVASLYPASTVLLALAVDRERLRMLQVAGLGLAATALVLTTA